jgi:hypothetical protein
MNYFKGFDQTRLQRLSALAPEAVERLTNTTLFSAIQALSGQPVNHYEQMKLQYFGSDYKFPTLQDIQVPCDFSATECTDFIANYQTQFNNTLMQHVTGYSTTLLETSSIEQSLEMLSDLQDFKVKDDDIKWMIRYNEFMQTITLNDICQDPYEANAKFLTFFVNNLKQKY